MPKINGQNLAIVIKNFDGEPFKREISEKVSVSFDIRYAMRGSLTQNIPGDETDDKFELFELARRIHNHPLDQNLELKQEEVQKILSRAKKLWPTEIYGHLYDVLNGNGKYPPLVKK